MRSLILRLKLRDRQVKFQLERVDLLNFNFEIEQKF
jgi:hypothetical protein